MTGLKEIGEQDSGLAAELQIVGADHFCNLRVQDPFALRLNGSRIAGQPDCLIVLHINFGKDLRSVCGLRGSWKTGLNRRDIVIGKASLMMPVYAEPRGPESGGCGGEILSSTPL